MPLTRMLCATHWTSAFGGSGSSGQFSVACALPTASRAMETARSSPGAAPASRAARNGSSVSHSTSAAGWEGVCRFIGQPFMLVALVDAAAVHGVVFGPGRDRVRHDVRLHAAELGRAGVDEELEDEVQQRAGDREV